MDKIMDYTVMNDNTNIQGTYLQGIINISYTKLVEKFGLPLAGDDYKVDAEWIIKINDSTATIYNWKNGKNYLGKHGLDIEDITEWHIGGYNPNIVKKVHLILTQK